jgi:hypothetical protein
MRTRGKRRTYCIEFKPEDKPQNSWGEIRLGMGTIWMCTAAGSPGVWKEIK